MSSNGRLLDLAEDALGGLQDSSPILDDTAALRQRMTCDNYLYIRGFWTLDEVVEGRRLMIERIADRGWLDPSRPPESLWVRPGLDTAPINASSRIHGDLAKDNPGLKRFLFSGRLREFWERFLGGPMLHFDNVNTRVTAPGQATFPHCDSVYMGRGTRNRFTAWVPYVDVPVERGGLMILENSHLSMPIQERYANRDVDEYCENRPNAAAYARADRQWTGQLARDAHTLRQKIGGRWLTADFQAGDLLVFTLFLVHASLDNRSQQLRLSSDSRYQLASDPVDERHMGPNPAMHGPRAKRGRIC
ncbi:MAG: phytanoyl-CoA dioxygenase family protein [Opitutaceae bacterium]